jgi:iron complex transport system substrate-binding protein
MSADESVTYPRVSLEEVIRKRPEVIIISSMERGGSYEEARRQWMKWPSIPAVRDRRVHLVDSDLLDRPSPRVVAGLETLARLFHPQAAWRFER